MACDIRGESDVRGEGVLLDSVILIDHFNGVEKATTYLRRVEGRARVSAIARAEVLSGFEPPQAGLARMLLDSFPLIVIDRPVADLGAELRRTFRWRLPDALQAAAATHHGLKLATRNTTDFPAKRFDFVVVPSECERERARAARPSRRAARACGKISGPNTPLLRTLPRPRILREAV